MSIIRPFEATDIQRFHTVNADPWTATYHNGYYAQYLAQWPDLCYAAQGTFEPDVGAYSGCLILRSWALLGELCLADSG